MFFYFKYQPLILLLFFSSLSFAYKKCPQDKEPLVVSRKSLGLLKTEYFFLLKKDKASTDIIWCDKKKKKGKVFYKYKGSLKSSEINDKKITTQSVKKLFSKSVQKIKIVKIYFHKLKHKKNILVFRECLDQKKKKCSSAKEIYEFFSKIIITSPPQETTKCRRTLDSTCQGDPKPLYLKNHKLYCETHLYHSKKQRKHDFYVKENKRNQSKIGAHEEKFFSFIPPGSSNPKAKMGSGYYLKSKYFNLNSKRPLILWQWNKLNQKSCTSSELAELKSDIKREFSSNNYLKQYKKEAIIYTQPKSPVTKSSKIAVFVLGAAASGKTTTTKKGISVAINNHFCPKGKAPFCNLKFLIIDGGTMRDVSRVWLDLKEIATDRGYAGFKDQYSIFSSSFKKLKTQLIDSAIKKGENLIIPETAAAEFLKFKGGPVKKVMDKLSKAGYKILMTSIYVSKAQAKKFGKARALKEGKTYSSLGWLFAQQQAEILMNYSRKMKYSPELPMYIFSNDKKFWKIKNPIQWFGTKGVKVTIPPKCTVKRSCNLIGTTCKFKENCSSN